MSQFAQSSPADRCSIRTFDDLLKAYASGPLTRSEHPVRLRGECAYIEDSTIDPPFVIFSMSKSEFNRTRFFQDNLPFDVLNILEDEDDEETSTEIDDLDKDFDTEDDDDDLDIYEPEDEFGEWDEDDDLDDEDGDLDDEDDIEDDEDDDLDDLDA